MKNRLFVKDLQGKQLSQFPPPFSPSLERSTTHAPTHNKCTVPDHLLHSPPTSPVYITVSQLDQDPLCYLICNSQHIQTLFLLSYQESPKFGISSELEIVAISWARMREVKSIITPSAVFLLLKITKAKRKLEGRFQTQVQQIQEQPSSNSKKGVAQQYFCSQ